MAFFSEKSWGKNFLIFPNERLFFSLKNENTKCSLGTRPQSRHISINLSLWRPHTVSVYLCEYLCMFEEVKAGRQKDIKVFVFRASLISFPTISLSLTTVLVFSSSLPDLGGRGGEWVSHMQTFKSAQWQFSPTLSRLSERECNLCSGQEERGEDICSCALFCIHELRFNSDTLLKWLANSLLCSNWPW